MTNKEYLKEWEREAVLFIERYHAVSGKCPDNDEIAAYITSLKKFGDVIEEEVSELRNDHLFKESMRVRGIELTNDPMAKSLTPRQMAAAAVMLNLVDRRSDEKKLRDLGISTEEYATWMQNDTFATYMQGRAEKLIDNSTHEAHMGLLKAIRGGNIQAVKLHYELTGRYNPDQDNAVNVRVMLGRIIEIIQKHVKDPNTLTAMATELQQLAIESTATGTGHSQPKVIREVEGQWR
jgi:hypothetical protein